MPTEKVKFRNEWMSPLGVERVRARDRVRVRARAELARRYRAEFDRLRAAGPGSSERRRQRAFRAIAAAHDVEFQRIKRRLSKHEPSLASPEASGEHASPSVGSVVSGGAPVARSRVTGAEPFDPEAARRRAAEAC